MQNHETKKNNCVYLIIVVLHKAQIKTCKHKSILAESTSANVVASGTTDLSRHCGPAGAFSIVVGMGKVPVVVVDGSRGKGVCRFVPTARQGNGSTCTIFPSCVKVGIGNIYLWGGCLRNNDSRSLSLGLLSAATSLAGEDGDE